MRRIIELLLLSLSPFAASLATGTVADAWSSDGKGNITCADGSGATAVQNANGNWTVTRAGNKGSVGGSFPIEGKAALSACGE